MLPALRRYWFLLLLLATLVVGICWAEPLKPMSEQLPRDWIIGCVLLAMALPLRFDSLATTLSNPRPALLAIGVSWLLVPLLAWLASFLLSHDLARGLIIAAAVPSTLASGAVWTRLAGGNDAMSLLVTVITNLSCFLVTPALIQFYSGESVSSVSFGKMASKLFVLIVLPLVLAQILRRFSPVAVWASEKKVLLSIFAQLGLLSIVFLGAVHCGLKIKELATESTHVGGQLALMAVLAAVVHTAAWAIGFWSAGRLGIARPDQIAVGFAGSQKTLMVCLAIALPFGGLTILPMLAYHVEQLLIDTFIADRLKFSVLAVDKRR
jgi:sodium/bile acid cotransporter 7